MSNRKTSAPLLLFLALSLLLGTTAARAQSNPILTLNKSHVPAGVLIFQVGAPITYVIEVLNSGATNANVSVTDTLPPGFIQVGAAACTYSFSATGPNPCPALGPFNVPTGGKVVITINGYFTTVGPKTNTAVAGAKDAQGNALPVGNA